ncbi:hypothetical protein F5B20DRAFT_524184 [Whalleya microplaca]|nr:hypothetical protein F5B20DRAFT_524184 [Whalleya microplaca]
MRFMPALLFSLLSSAAPLSSSHTMNPDAVDFSSVGDEYKRGIQSPDKVDFDAVGDEYKRNIQTPEEVDFNAVGDEY